MLETAHCVSKDNDAVFSRQPIKRHIEGLTYRIRLQPIITAIVFDNCEVVHTFSQLCEHAVKAMTSYNSFCLEMSRVTS